MSAHLFTIDELRRLESLCYMGGVEDLAAKLRDHAMNEYSVRGSRTGIALTPVEVVKQMILDSPLARVPDTAQPLNVVNVAIPLPYLRRLIEAVEAL